jgi:hypothetical protein
LCGWARLLDPLNHRPAALSRPWAGGGLVYRWLLAGLVCGLLWEFWNFWAVGRWQYVGVPVLPSLRLFEMPLAGYLGFPPIALEAFAMYHSVRPLAGLPAPEAS